MYAVCPLFMAFLHHLAAFTRGAARWSLKWRCSNHRDHCRRRAGCQRTDSISWYVPRACFSRWGCCASSISRRARGTTLHQGCVLPGEARLPFSPSGRRLISIYPTVLYSFVAQGAAGRVSSRPEILGRRRLRRARLCMMWEMTGDCGDSVLRSRSWRVGSGTSAWSLNPRAACSCSNAQSCSTCSEPLGGFRADRHSAPSTDRPTSPASGRLCPDSLMRRTHANVCVSSASPLKTRRSSWRTQTVCSGAGATRFQFGVGVDLRGKPFVR